MVLAMLVVMAGCANGGNTDNNSALTSSVNSTVTNTDNQLNEETDEEETDEEETDEEDEKYYVADGGYTEITTANAQMIIYNYLDLQSCCESNGPAALLGYLGIVKDFKIYEDEIITIKPTSYKKTNVKYADYKNKLLTYMSQKRMEEYYLGDGLCTEKDGYLYICDAGASGYSFGAFSTTFLKEENGVYTYLVTCELDEMGDVGNCYIKANIIKENGMYVLDSYEYIQRKDTLFKGYDKLNNTTAAAIIENYLVLKNSKHADICGFIEDLVDVEVQLNENKTIETKWGTRLKSNIKYKDFEKAALKYMSKTRFKNDIMKDGTIVEKDGYLYTQGFGASGEGVGVLKVKLQNKKNGKYEYLANCKSYFYDDIEEDFKVKAIIIKQNGVYVLDSYEVVKN
jgi:hypothetical protein